MTFITYTEQEMTKIRIVDKLNNSIITVKDAKLALWVGERTIYRYLKKLRDKWPPGLLHWLRWKPSNNQIVKMDVYKKYAMKDQYHDLGPTLLAEELEEECWWWKINPESLRLNMIKRGLRTVKKRNTKVRKQKRDRRTNKWMMIQFDWSYHDWLEDWVKRCLLLAVDDASSELVKWTLTIWETLWDMIKFWREYFLDNGKPECIYVDCHATYKVNHEKDMFDKEMITRFQRAMRKLWIDVIYSHQPEWKWRVERAFRTLQDRLIKKMRLRWCKTVKEAQKYINDVYITEHNKKFAVKPEEKEDLHKEFTKHEQEMYDWYFAKETWRIIKKDGTVQYMNKVYQIKKWEILYNWNKVIVYETEEWKLEIYSWKVKLEIIKVTKK
jgi:hypothetical protein